MVPPEGVLINNNNNNTNNNDNDSAIIVITTALLPVTPTRGHPLQIKHIILTNNSCLLLGIRYLSESFI